MQLHTLILQNYPIYYQLKLEEALLRTSEQNWLVLNLGSSPAVVMGISGDPNKLIDLQASEKANIPVIKRFSGGGTVVVDENTLFFSLIMQKSDEFSSLSPREIMRFVEKKIAKAFPSSFSLTETDFTLGNKKIGGNAQYIQKNRWLHHTTFLWDYLPERMELLKHPEKKPEYRGERLHAEFLSTLNPYYESMNDLAARLVQSLGETFSLQLTSLQQASLHLENPHRSSTVYIDFSLYPSS